MDVATAFGEIPADRTTTDRLIESPTFHSLASILYDILCVPQQDHERSQTMVAFY